MESEERIRLARIAKIERVLVDARRDLAEQLRCDGRAFLAGTLVLGAEASQIQQAEKAVYLAIRALQDVLYPNAGSR